MIKFGKLLNSAVKLAKAHPEKVLVVASLVAPGIVARVAPRVLPVIVALGKKPAA